MNEKGIKAAAEELYNFSLGQCSPVTWEQTSDDLKDSFRGSVKLIIKSYEDASRDSDEIVRQGI